MATSPRFHAGARMVGLVGSVEHRAVEPLFASQLASGVSRRSAPLPTSLEVAPTVAAYLRQVGGEALVPPQLIALLPAPVVVAPPVRSRETVILVALAVLLFIAAFVIAMAVLPASLA